MIEKKWDGKKFSITNYKYCEDPFVIPLPSMDKYIKHFSENEKIEKYINEMNKLFQDKNFRKWMGVK